MSPVYDHTLSFSKPWCHVHDAYDVQAVKLGGFPWLQALVCVNPLIYVTEGFRAALTTTGHMHLYVIYPVLLGLCALFLWAGIRGFRRRVLS